VGFLGVGGRKTEETGGIPKEDLRCLATKAETCTRAVIDDPQQKKQKGGEVKESKGNSGGRTPVGKNGTKREAKWDPGRRKVKKRTTKRKSQKW